MTVNWWERGVVAPHPHNAAKLAAVLQTDLATLLAAEEKVEADTITVPTSKVRQNRTTSESRYV